MRVIVFGSGTIGSEVKKALEEKGHEVLSVSRSSGDFQADISNQESLKALFSTIGHFDAVANAAGEVVMGPLEHSTDEQWEMSIKVKMMGQINIVRAALPYIADKGSFTLISGVLTDEFLAGGVCSTTINYAIEGFVKSAAVELPRGLRINCISPTVLVESMPIYSPAFPGFIPVEGWKVAQAYVRAIMGIINGRILPVN